MSRTTLYHCNRCGASILDGRHSIVRVEAGELAKRFDEPIDLRGSCADGFQNWLRSGQQGVQVGLGAPLGGLVVESPVPVG